MFELAWGVHVLVSEVVEDCELVLELLVFVGERLAVEIGLGPSVPSLLIVALELKLREI